MTSGKYLFFILLISTYLPESYSQEFSRGFIFSRKGDAISVFIQLPSTNMAAGRCVFKPRMRDNPSDITGFGAGRSHPVSASDGRYGFAGLGLLSDPLTYFKDFWKYDPEL